MSQHERPGAGDRPVRRAVLGARRRGGAAPAALHRLRARPLPAGSGLSRVPRPRAHLGPDVGHRIAAGLDGVPPPLLPGPPGALRRAGRAHAGGPDPRRQPRRRPTRRARPTTCRCARSSSTSPDPTAPGTSASGPLPNQRSSNDPDQHARRDGVAGPRLRPARPRRDHHRRRAGHRARVRPRVRRRRGGARARRGQRRRRGARGEGDRRGGRPVAGRRDRRRRSGLGRGAGRHRDGGARPRRRPGQQRGDLLQPHDAPVRRDPARRVGRGPAGQRHRLLPVRPRRRTAHAGGRLGPDRQHHVGRGAPRRPQLPALRDVEGGAGRDDELAGPRAGVARHHRQRGAARRHLPPRCPARRSPKRARRRSSRTSASRARRSRWTSSGWCSSSPRRQRASSPARPSPATAASPTTDPLDRRSS